MAQLDDFNTGTPAALEDFQTATVEPPVTSAGGNSNVAAHAAMLSPTAESVVPNYQQAKNELDQSGNSDTAAGLVANAKGQNLLGYRRATADFVTDPNTAQEWKNNALAFISDENNKLTSARAMVATKAATQVVPSETEESADLRGVYAATITNALDYQRKKQQFYNEMQQTADKSKTGSYVGMAEDLVPLASGIKQARLSHDLFGDQEKTLAPLWSTVLQGTSKAVMADRFNSMPLDARIKFFDKIKDVVQSDGSSLLLPEEYDNANMDAVRTITDAGHYSVTQETIDNVIGVADMIGIGSFLRGAGRAVKGAEAADKTPDIAKTADAAYEGMTAEQRSWARRYVLTDVQPMTPSQTIRDANPEQARQLNKAMVDDSTGDTATALYGTSREDAIAHDITPQVAAADGTVSSKVHHPEREGDFSYMPDADVLDFVDNTGAHWLAPSEKRHLRANVTNDFLNATGMSARKEMTTVEATDDGVKFGAVYGPTDSGWSSVKDAVDSATYHLRDYGIKPEDINILVRRDDEYVPVSLSALQGADAPGDFLLQVNHQYHYNAADVERDGWEAFDVKNNIFDRFLTGKTNGQGTLQSHLLDAQSMLHPDFTKGATISGLQGAGLERDLMKVVKPYVDTMKRLPSAARREKVFAKIRENNFKGQEPNYANMAAEGFAPAEIRAMEHWKAAQDTLYELSNRDMIKTYRTRGYGLIEHQDSGTRILGRELNVGAVPDNVKVFDPIKDEIIQMDRTAIQQHYTDGGNVAKTAAPIRVGTDTVEHVLNMNKPGSTFVRGLTSSDRLLNYRKGYYAVRYRNPHFVERKVTDAEGRAVLDEGGREKWRAVASAANIPDAERAVARLNKTTAQEHRWRSDLKGESFEVAEAQRTIAGGMSSQRVRGQRLEEATGGSELSEAQHIASPMESLVNSVSSVSARISHRDFLETAKQRFIAQYSDVLPKVRGQVEFPRSRGDIGLPHNNRSKMAGDARTTWEYIRQMENGYINSIDDGWKAALNAVADFAGVNGFGRTEELIRAAGQSGPTQVGKMVSFNLLLATNPLRQLLVQSHQIVMLGARFPHYAFNQLGWDMMLLMTHHLGGTPSKALLKWTGRTAEESKAMFDAVKASNISAGISKHEMVRQSLTSIADGGAQLSRKIPAVNAFTKPVGAAIGMVRKVGFDFGEYLSSAASFLAHYNDAVEKGIKIGKSELDDITSQSRNFVYNMDQAGAAPYNHNSAALLTQFMQVAHKALLQMTFNRGLTATQKGVLAGYTMMMFSPSSVIGLSQSANNAFENYLTALLPDDPKFRNGILDGIEGVFLNKFLTQLYGENVNLDYSSLAPLDAYGITEFFNTFTEEGLAKAVASSPTGSLIFGSNPRLTNVAVTAGRLLGLGTNPGEQEPVRWSNLAMDVANLSSGFSNAYKAAMALEYGRKYGALGGTSDKNVNTPEALAKALGIDTKDEQLFRKIMDSTYKNQESMEGDVKKVFSEFARRVTQDGITAEQVEYYISLNQMAMAQFKGNPQAMQIFQGELRKQQTDKGSRLMDTLLKQCGWAKPEDVKRLVARAPGITDEQRQGLMTLCDWNFDNRPDLRK
ncbi:hypothetical protein [Erwinia phage Pecta]|nr:hypothetical protein [Erwinia phage Pecta]